MGGGGCYLLSYSIKGTAEFCEFSRLSYVLKILRDHLLTLFLPSGTIIHYYTYIVFVLSYFRFCNIKKKKKKSGCTYRVTCILSENFIFIFQFLSTC